jgi:hypothetical protein
MGCGASLEVVSIPRPVAGLAVTGAISALPSLLPRLFHLPYCPRGFTLPDIVSRPLSYGVVTVVSALGEMRRRNPVRMGSSEDLELIEEGRRGTKKL